MKSRGSALIYILIAIALLGALTMSFIEPSSQQSRSQNAFKVASQLKSQIEFYRAAIQDCILTHPKGDTSNPTKYTGYNSPYPLTSSSTYLDAGKQVAGDVASGISCPGNPGDSNDHAFMFGGSTGKFAPLSPNLFDELQYYNVTDGVYLLVKTDKTDPYLGEAMLKAAAGYNSCETDYISDETAPCETDYLCWRVWVIRNTAC